jgi:ribosome-associated protein
MIKVTDSVGIDEGELSFSFSRSGGPGGQNVNKLDTRVTVSFDLEGCRGLDGVQKRRIRSRLASRINKEGFVRVVSQRHRSQKANRDAAVEKLVELLAVALKRRPVRKKTAVPRAAKEKRLEAKKRRSQVKQRRKRVGPGDYEG